MVKTYVMLDPKMIKALPVVAMKNPAMAKQMILNSVRNEGLNTIFQKYGPIASIMFHDKFLPSGGERGGLGATFGPRLADAASKLTEWGPRGGILSTKDWLSSGGGTGPMGGTFLPRATGWASRLGIQGTPASRGTGILGGKVGPWLADLFGFDPGTSGSSARTSARTSGDGGFTYWDPVNQMYIDKSTGKESTTPTGYVSQGAQIDLSKGFGKK